MFGTVFASIICGVEHSRCGDCRDDAQYQHDNNQFNQREPAAFLMRNCVLCDQTLRNCSLLYVCGVAPTIPQRTAQPKDVRQSLSFPRGLVMIVRWFAVVTRSPSLAVLSVHACPPMPPAVVAAQLCRTHPICDPQTRLSACRRQSFSPWIAFFRLHRSIRWEFSTSKARRTGAMRIAT